MRRKIEEVLEELRPVLQQDGGNVELADYRDGIAYLRLTGACHGCAHAGATMRNHLEKRLRERIPRLKGVLQVKDPS
ncbi:MAG: NifU family protein [Myxococcota bacterium]|jgi:Fe-S cluster biogenesis protein NfuA|nr:NifU family protein [Myxococcota bacterium]